MERNPVSARSAIKVYTPHCLLVVNTAGEINGLEITNDDGRK